MDKTLWNVNCAFLCAACFSLRTLGSLRLCEAGLSVCGVIHNFSSPEHGFDVFLNSFRVPVQF